MNDRAKAAERPTVLIVDDESLLRMDLADVFEGAGYSVFEAADAAEAVAVLKTESSIRIVVTDIQMPGSMDGLRLARFIRDAYPPIALIVASGAIRPVAAELPTDAIFLPKPIDMGALLGRIDTLMAEHRKPTS